MPRTQLCQRRLGDMPSGAHMEIGTYGDLATMHWVQNEAWSPDVLDCAVTYGAPPCSPSAKGRGTSCREN